MAVQNVASKDVSELAFPEHYEAAVHGVRAAFTELLLSVGVDSSNSRDLARRLKLSKNLTWMVSKVVNSNDVYSIAQHIPGSARIESLLTAVKKGGATTVAVDNLRAAFRRFNEMVAMHAGDRAMLELMVAEMSSDDVRADQLVACRKLAFRGNSGTLGVQAKVHMACGIVAPSADDPSLADLVQVGGLFGFRRLRSSARWLLFRRARWEDDGTPSNVSSEDALITDSDGVPLLTEFCSNPVPQLDLLQQDGELQYELPPGPVGNTAAATCVYGSVMRRTGPLCRDEHNRFMELGCNLVTPAETLVHDLLVHASMSWALKPDLGVFTRMVAGPEHLSSARERNRMVVTEAVADLGRGIGALVTPHMPRHVELLQTVFDRVGWNPDEFYALRLVMPYPPIPATVLFSSELPEKTNS